MEKRKVKLAISTLDRKVSFKQKMVRDKEDHYIMTNASIHKEGISMHPMST